MSILHPSFPPSSDAATVEIIQKKNKPPHQQNQTAVKTLLGLARVEDELN